MEMNALRNLTLEIEKRYGKLLSLEKVAEYLGFDVPTAGELVKSGELDSLEIAGKFMVKPVQLAKFELDITEMPDTSSPVTESEVNVMKVSEGSIYNVKSNKNPFEMRFFITFDDGVKRAVKVRGTNEEEIRQKKEDRVAEELEKYRREKDRVAVQEPVDTKVITFREVSEMWFEEFKLHNDSKGNSYSNAESARYSIKAINSLIGDFDIREIDTVKAQQMINEISVNDDGNYKSKSFVEKVMRKFKSVMEYGLEHGYTNVKMGKLYMNRNLSEPSRDSRFIDLDGLTILLECVAKNNFYNTLVNLILYTGLRQEEALALSIDDVEEYKGIYRIFVSKAVVEVSRNRYEVVNRLKHGERARYISILKETFDMLNDYYKLSMEDANMVERRKENGTTKLLFVNKYGQIHNKRTLYHSLVGYLERNTGTEDAYRLHMLRHTFASFMADEIPIDDVSEVLGHRDVSITKRFYDSQTLVGQQRVSKGMEEMMKKIKNSGIQKA